MSQPSPILLAELAYPTHRGKDHLIHNLQISTERGSFKYLIAKGRVDEARALLIRNHAAGDRDSLLVQYEIDQIQAALATGANTDRLRLTHILASPANLRRLLISGILGIAA